MGHWMGNQDQGTRRGPTGDIDGTGPMRGGPCLAHHPAAQRSPGMDGFGQNWVPSETAEDGFLLRLGGSEKFFKDPHSL